MTIVVKHQREDGSYVIERDGMPYHVLPSDPIWSVVEEAASLYTLEPEPAPPPPPAMPPRNVSLRQLLRALVATGFISKAEALAAARTGDIPASLRAPLFAAVDADAAFEIELAWAAMYEAERASPFWGFVLAAGIATAEQIDQVFAVATES